jgi:hypothetical protein
VSRWFPERTVLHLAAADALAGVTAGALGGAPGLPSFGAPTSSPAGAVAGAGTGLRERVREGALAAFEARLDALQAPRRGRVTCVIAGDLARYCIVPWNPQAFGAVRREAFARHCFHEIHGDAASAWSVRADEPAYGQAALACAIETVLIDGVAARLKERGWLLDSVQPSLMHAARGAAGRAARALPGASRDGASAARAAMRSGSFWLVVQEPRTTTLWLVVQHQPMVVRVLAAREHDLGLVLAREWLALGLEPAHCPVIVAAADLTLAPRLAPWKLRVLGGVAARAGADSARALRIDEPAAHGLGTA